MDSVTVKFSWLKEGYESKMTCKPKVKLTIAFGSVWSVCARLKVTYSGYDFCTVLVNSQTDRQTYTQAWFITLADERGLCR